MTTKDLQEGVRKRSIVLSFAVDGDFTFAPSTGFVLPDVPSTTDMIVKKTGGKWIPLEISIFSGSY